MTGPSLEKPTPGFLSHRGSNASECVSVSWCFMILAWIGRIILWFDLLAKLVRYLLMLTECNHYKHAQTHATQIMEIIVLYDSCTTHGRLMANMGNIEYHYCNTLLVRTVCKASFHESGIRCYISIENVGVSKTQRTDVNEIEMGGFALYSFLRTFTCIVKASMAQEMS